MLSTKIENFFLDKFSISDKPELTLMKRNLFLGNPGLFLDELKKTNNCQFLDPKIVSQGFGTFSFVKFSLFTTSTTCYFMILSSVLLHRKANSYTVTRGLRNFVKNLHFVLMGTGVAYAAKVKNHYDLIDNIVETSDMTEEECLNLLEKTYSGEFSLGKREERRMLLSEKENKEFKSSIKILRETGEKKDKEDFMYDIGEIVRSRNFKAAFDIF